MLYHVTFANRLPEIAQKGLQPGQRMTIPWDEAAKINVKDRLFFSKSLSSAKIWGNYIPLAYWEHFKSSEIPVPVLLKADYSGRVWPDVGFGITDSVFGVKPIPPTDISLWDPLRQRWIPLDKIPKGLVEDTFELESDNLYESIPKFVERVQQYVQWEWP